MNGINSLTRSEIAALKLPQVAFIPEKDVLITSATEMDMYTSDPKLARQRPSETTVQHTLQVLASRASDSSTAVDSGDEDENEVAVTIGKLGIYTRTSVRVFEKMCMLSSESAKVNAEKRWLSQPSAQDVSKVKEILLNERPSDEVLRHGQFVIDSSGFSMLACERYVNGFTIDVVSFKLLENSKPTGVIYFPSFSQTWAKQGAEYFKHKVAPSMSQCPVEDVTCILTPVHIESPEHWGDCFVLIYQLLLSTLMMIRRLTLQEIPRWLSATC